MDKKIGHNFIVGIFVLAGLVGFLFVIFSIGGGSGIFSRDYVLHGKFTQVKGLNYGSEVSLAGLRIGVVKKISISDATTKELVVDMAIEKEFQDKVREDSVAMIKTSGVLGDKYIEFSIGSPEVPVLKDNALIRTSEPEDILAKGNDLVEGISSNFKKGSDLEQVLSNLNRVSQNLAIITSEIRTQKGLYHEVIYGTSGAKLNQTMTSLSSIIRKIDSGEGTLGALVNDPTVYEDIKTIMGGAKRSSVLKYFMHSFMESGKEGEKAQGKPAPQK
jgi:phospholipid/cholesterol/gamma-HCH transport system substrate-binding protein